MKFISKCKSVFTSPASSRQFSIKHYFSRGGGCIKNEQALRKFQSICEDETSKIEKLFPQAGPSFLLQMLYKCQKISVKDKFFYDALLARIEEQLHLIRDSSTLTTLGVALSISPDLQKDNQPFLLKFYEHVYNNRFILNQEDKKELSRIFNVLSLGQKNKKHLDLFQDIKGKELTKQALKAFEIELPENILMDFDFENRVVIMKNRKTQQMIIMFGSEHHCEQSISFGKQLIDTFKPKTLLVEDSPIDSDNQQGNPFADSRMLKVAGNDFKLFVNSCIIQNQQNYKVDEKNKVVYVNDFQGLPMKIPSDFPTYAYYHYLKQEKDHENSQLVFCDLSSAEKSSSFILSLTEPKRQQLKKELQYLILLDTASWLADIHKLGCYQCASFLNRQKIQQYPSRPIQLLSEEQIPSFADREKCIAHNILRTVLQENKQQNFVAFVGSDHLIGVTKQMANLLNKGEEFMSYKRPVSYIDDPKIQTDHQYRKELIKRHALSSIIYDQGGEAQASPPFKVSDEDKQFQKVYELKYLQKISMANVFGDIEDFGIKFDQDDFIKEEKMKKEQVEILEEEKYLKEYLDKKGGKLKCLPLSYLQGNFAYYYTQRNEFIDQCMQNVEKLSKNYVKTLDYSSGEDEDVKE